MSVPGNVARVVLQFLGPIGMDVFVIVFILQLSKPKWEEVIFFVTCTRSVFLLPLSWVLFVGIERGGMGTV